MNFYGKIVFIILLFYAPSSFSNNVLKACGHHDYAPWNWLKEGQIVGACAEIASNLYAKIGYELDLSYVGPWARCQKMIADGTVDINICSLKNDTREKYSVFSQVPIAHNEQAIFVRVNDGFEFSQLEDLNQKTIGIVRGVSLGNKIDQYLKQNARLFFLADYGTLFNMLQMKRIDGVIVGRESGKSYIQLNNLSDGIVDLPNALVVADLYISISKKSKFVDTLSLLQPVINASDYRLRYQALFVKYNNEFIQGNKPNEKYAELEPIMILNKNTHRTIQVDNQPIDND